MYLTQSQHTCLQSVRLLLVGGLALMHLAVSITATLLTLEGAADLLVKAILLASIALTADLKLVGNQAERCL